MSNAALNSAAGGLTGIVVPGDGASFTATSSDGDWPASTRLRVQTAAGTETVLTPIVAGTLATWALTIAQVTGLVGTKTSGSLKARLTTGTADMLRGLHAGRLSILDKWNGINSPQSLGVVSVGTAGASVESGAIDVDGNLVLTLDNGIAIAPVSLPPLVALTPDADGDYATAGGTVYQLTTDTDGDYAMREII